MSRDSLGAMNRMHTVDLPMLLTLPGAPAGASGASPDSVLASVLLLLSLLALSGFFSSSETALFSLQPIDRESLKRQGSTGRLVETLRARPRRLLATLLMGNEIVNVTISVVAAAFFESLRPGLGWLTILIVTPALVLFGEALPKTLALRFNRRVALLNVRPLHLFYLLVSPFRWVFSRVVEVMASAFGVSSTVADIMREEQIRTLVDQGTAQGSIRPVEQELIHAVFEFGDLPVGRVMTPRPDLIMIDLRASWEDLLDTVRSSGASRLPVYVNDKDNVIGVLLAKDLLRFLGRPPPKTRQIQQLLHRVPFVPTTKRVDDLLDELRKRKVHLALVVDEHGSLAGLVTLDDLLGELIGELRDDPRDRAQDDVRPIEPHGWLVNAGIDIDDFNDFFDVELPPGEYQTLGGFILSELGALPEPGRALRWRELTLTVTSVRKRRILEVRVDRERAEAPAEDASSEPGAPTPDEVLP